MTVALQIPNPLDEIEVGSEISCEMVNTTPEKVPDEVRVKLVDSLPAPGTPPAGATAATKESEFWTCDLPATSNTGTKYIAVYYREGPNWHPSGTTQVEIVSAPE